MPKYYCGDFAFKFIFCLQVRTMLLTGQNDENIAAYYTLIFNVLEGINICVLFPMLFVGTVMKVTNNIIYVTFT
jgi:hypothetical protein